MCFKKIRKCVFHVMKSFSAKVSCIVCKREKIITWTIHVMKSFFAKVLFIVYIRRTIITWIASWQKTNLYFINRVFHVMIFRRLYTINSTSAKKCHNVNCSRYDFLPVAYYKWHFGRKRFHNAKLAFKEILKTLRFYYMKSTWCCTVVARSKFKR